MEIILSDRLIEAKNKMQECVFEINDYNRIVMCLKALQACKIDVDNKYTYSQEEFDKVTNELYRLCEKHEVQIPQLEDIEWDSIEIK